MAGAFSKQSQPPIFCDFCANYSVVFFHKFNRKESGGPGLRRGRRRDNFPMAGKFCPTGSGHVLRYYWTMTMPARVPLGISSGRLEKFKVQGRFEAWATASAYIKPLGIIDR
jgi:hypothetical protein